MASRKTKNGDSEKLDSANLDRVIGLLEAEKPITKKEACNILNIAYNTTRLGSLIEKHKERKQKEKERRQEKRGKPATPEEIKYVITGYLEGSSIEHLANSIFRSPIFVRGILDKYSVPLRSRSYNYFKPELIPEEASVISFKPGEVAYSARYDSVCRIDGEVPHKEEKVYRIWLISDKWSQFAYQPASELASLKHLEELGVRF